MWVIESLSLTLSLSVTDSLSLSPVLILGYIDLAREANHGREQTFIAKDRSSGIFIRGLSTHASRCICIKM